MPGPYDYVAPQANQNPEAYGPLDLGIWPHLQDTAMNLAQAFRQQRMERAAAAMAQEQEGRHREEAAYKKQRSDVLYGQTVPDVFRPQVDETIGMPTRPEPGPQAFAYPQGSVTAVPAPLPRSGLSTNLTSPYLPAPRGAGFSAYVPGVAQSDAALRELALGGRLEHWEDLVEVAAKGQTEARRRNLATEQAAAQRAVIARSTSGVITPKDRAAKITQILQNALTGEGLMGAGKLEDKDLNSLRMIVQKNKKSIAKGAAEDSRASAALASYIQALIPFLSED